MSASALLNKFNLISRTNAATLFGQSRVLLQSKIKSGSKLLDLGTGDGGVFNEIFLKNSGLKFSKIIGSDFDPEHVKFATEKYSNQNLSFEVFDASKEPPKSIRDSAPYDIVTSFHMLHIIKFEQIISAVKNVKSLLKQNGYFYFFIPLNMCPPDLEAKLLEKYPEGQGTPIANFFGPNVKRENIFEDIREVLKNEGFDLILFDSQPLSYTYAPGQMKGKINSNIFCQFVRESSNQNSILHGRHLFLRTL